MQIRKLLGLSVFISLSLLFIWGGYSRYQLKHNYILTNATITDAGIQMQKNGSWIVVYSFTLIDGKKVSHEGLYHIYYEKKDSLIGRNIPCAYYKKDYRRSELLIYKQTWKQYGLEYPDSLQWTKNYFKDIIYSY